MITDDERLQLNTLLTANSVSDQTDLIRRLKHSELLRDQVKRLLEIKASAVDDVEKDMMMINECSFLFTYYTDVFNRFKNDEMEFSLFDNFLKILKKIEDGEYSQHEGSILCGRILKEAYLDSAIKKGKKMDEKYPETVKEVIPIDENRREEMTWAEYKASLPAKAPREARRVREEKKKEPEKPKETKEELLRRLQARRKMMSDRRRG